MHLLPWHLLTLVVLVACGRSEPEAIPDQVNMQPAMAAASGVTHADSGKGPREQRIVPMRPMSGDVELLYGDPEIAGEPFVMRIRELPGTVVPPHSHPVDEHLTVVQGVWYFGFGERYDPAQLQELKPGTYAFAPKGSWMFGYSPDGAIVQVHGTGPFQIHWHDGVKMLNDSGANTVFRFKRNDSVASRRGTGRVVEAYASGTLIQYEIEGTDGKRHMAHEHELYAK